MDSFGVVTRDLSANYEKLFEYLADLKTLPTWTKLFSDADDTSSLLEFPDGSVHRIKIDIESSIETGVVDWLMHMPDGSVATAYSRLTKLDDENVIFNFMFIVPPLPSEEEKAGFLESQLQLIRDEFDLLEGVLVTDARFQ